jgi:serine acetyltransferase
VTVGTAPAFARFSQAVRSDHTSLLNFGLRYPSEKKSGSSLLVDAVQKIGFQMLISIRLMHLLRDLRIPFGKQLVSRLIRHLYSAEIHWDAKIAPGVTFVHGNGLVISHGAVVGAGCLIFQGVTFGESFDSAEGTVGAPVLEENVHVMPNAVLIGPIRVGANSKIMANVTLGKSVPPNSIVRSAEPLIELRTLAPEAPTPDAP